MSLDNLNSALSALEENLRTSNAELRDRVNMLEQKGDPDGTLAKEATQFATKTNDDCEGVTLLSAADLRGGQAAIASRLKIATRGAVPQMSDFLRGVAGGKTTAEVKANLAEGADATGGYAVPTVLMPGILSQLVPNSSLLSAGASVAVLSEQAKSYRIAGINAIPTAAWRLEGGTVAASDPTFQAIDLVPRSLSFKFTVSREMMQDSPGLYRALNLVIAQAFAKEMDRAGLRGSGTAPEVRGILNVSGIQSVTNGTNGAALAGYANFISAVQAISTANAPLPTAAIMHPRSWAKLAGLVDTTGQPLRLPDALKDMRFIQSSQIPVNLTVGSSSDCSEIYVADFSNFVFFMRENVSIQLCDQISAGTGEVTFFCHARLDVAPLYPAAMAVVTGVRA